jgi:hypothetical protein
MFDKGPHLLIDRALDISLSHLLAVEEPPPQ